MTINTTFLKRIWVRYDKQGYDITTPVLNNVHYSDFLQIVPALSNEKNLKNCVNVGVRRSV